MKNKNLILAFCSIRLASLSEEEKFRRENDYFVSLKQLFRVLPDGFDVVVCDNTGEDLDGMWHPRLKDLLSEKECLFFNENEGESNKGVGELDMLIRAMESVDHSEYEKIVYLTARRIITCPYIFEKTIDLKAQALLSNPPIINIADGYLYPDGEEVYNDMFFAMRSNFMKQYAEYSEKRLDLMSNPKKPISSEQNLYKFVNDNKIEFERISWLGMIRYDSATKEYQYC